MPIWVARVGNDLYVRSWRGTDGAWYRHATEQAGARVRAGNLGQEVIVSRIDDTEAATQRGHRVLPDRRRQHRTAHAAFYTGWPKAFSAMAVAQQVFGQKS